MPHTPGLWRLETIFVQPASDRCFTIIGPKGEAAAFANVWNDAEAEGRANAKLLAAAPDLLAALQLFTKASMFESRPTRGESFIGWQLGDGDSHTAMKAARAAIAKATI